MVIPIESPWETCSIYACIWMECKFRGRCCPLLACLVIQLLLKVAVKDHATLIVADHHPLNVHDEWSGNFSIFGTSMTSTMRTQDGLNISRGTGWSSWAFCFFYSMHHLLYQDVEQAFNSTKGAWHHRHVQVRVRNLTTLSPSQIELGNTFSFSFIILSQTERVGMGSIMLWIKFKKSLWPSTVIWLASKVQNVILLCYKSW